MGNLAEDPERIHEFLQSLPVKTSRLSESEWGLKVASDGAAPLEIGLRIAEGLLRVTAFVSTRSAAPPPDKVLQWNRHIQLARFGSTRGGELWIHGELPLEGLTETSIDRLLGTVVLCVWAARAERQ